MKRSWLLPVLAACACSHGHARHYDLAEIATLEWTGGLPLTGAGGVDVDLSVDPKEPVDDWSKVTGTVEITCAGCVLGAEHAKIDVPWKGSMGSLEVGRVALGTITGQVKLAAGDYDASLTMSSADLEVDFTAHGHLGKRIGDSTVEGCLAFRPTDALQQRNPQAFSLISLTGANRRADGFFTIRLSGTGRQTRRIAQDCAAR